MVCDAMCISYDIPKVMGILTLEKIESSVFLIVLGLDFTNFAVFFGGSCMGLGQNGGAKNYLRSLGS